MGSSFQGTIQLRLEWTLASRHVFEYIIEHPNIGPGITSQLHSDSYQREKKNTKFKNGDGRLIFCTRIPAEM